MGTHRSNQRRPNNLACVLYCFVSLSRKLKSGVNLWSPLTIQSFCRRQLNAPSIHRQEHVFKYIRRLLHKFHNHFAPIQSVFLLQRSPFIQDFSKFSALFALRLSRNRSLSVVFEHTKFLEFSTSSLYDPTTNSSFSISS